MISASESAVPPLVGKAILAWAEMGWPQRRFGAMPSSRLFWVGVVCRSVSIEAVFLYDLGSAIVSLNHNHFKCLTDKKC